MRFEKTATSSILFIVFICVLSLHAQGASAAVAPACVPTCVNGTLPLVIVSDSQTLANGVPSVATWDDHPWWTTNITGATWIWTEFLVSRPQNVTNATFTRSFGLPLNAVSLAGSVIISADNSYYCTLNGNLVGANSSEFNYFIENRRTFALNGLAPGLNMFRCEVSNFAQPQGNASTNPAGLLYRMEINGNCVVRCGNGVPESGEQCDDGNSNNNDACTNACQNARCGDGIVRTGTEECDDGNAVNTDGCTNSCKNAKCGDSFVWSGHEQCELPGSSGNPLCGQSNSSCSGARLGVRDAFGNCGPACGCVYDEFVYSCVKGQCGAGCSIDADCQSECAGSVRRFGGACEASGCSCSYSTEDCDLKDGWYNATDFRWVSADQCREKEQIKIELRDYSCAPDACTFVVVQEYWLDSGNARNKADGLACDDGLFCTTPDTCFSGVCSGPRRDCSHLDIPPIETCAYSPDDNPFTWDYFSGFTSVCDEANDMCTTGAQTLMHGCSVKNCNAECDGLTPCAGPGCFKTYNDYCSGHLLVDYNGNRINDYVDVRDSCTNTCQDDCTCTNCQVDCGPPQAGEYCVAGVCEAGCDSNDDCLNYCAGNVFNGGGQCDAAGCSCSYVQQDCSLLNHYDDYQFFCEGDAVIKKRLYHYYVCDAQAGCLENTDWSDIEIVSACSDQDKEYCAGDVLKRDDGYCENAECKVSTTVTQDCYYKEESCDGDARVLETGFCNADLASCDDRTNKIEICSDNDHAECQDTYYEHFYTETCQETGATTECAPASSLADCRDGLWCNGQETCSESGGVHCESGTPIDCADSNECTNDGCVEFGSNSGSCDNSNKPFGTWCGLARDCSDDECADPFRFFYPADGHDYCSEGSCIAYSCDSTGNECDVQCGAECDEGTPCADSECSVTYDDYCLEKKLVEYDDDKTLDSTTIEASCENTCQPGCECTDCTVDCSPPQTNSYCSGECGAECVADEDCDDENPDTVDWCGDCACNHDYQPECGNGNVDSGEACELPDTFNNPFCSQTTAGECQGNKLGVRDAFGDCNAGCGCVLDSFAYTCVEGQCGALCDSNEDCGSYCSETGNFRYFNGVCRTCSTCSCSYSYENCDSRDGWHNDVEYRWVPAGECMEKQQAKREYRDYSCAPEACAYAVTSEVWEDTLLTRSAEDGSACDDGFFCTDSDTCNAGMCSGQPRECGDDNECTDDACSEETDSCVIAADDTNVCGSPRDCPASLCDGLNWTSFPADGHDYCSAGECMAYSCAQTGSQYNAFCDPNIDSDEDGIPDGQDACPDVYGTACNGCPNPCTGCAGIACDYYVENIYPATGLWTLGAPTKWNLKNDGTLTLDIANTKHPTVVKIYKITATVDGVDTEFYPINLALEPNASTRVIFTATPKLDAGSDYVIELAFVFNDGGLNHTDVGTINGVVTQACGPTDQSCLDMQCPGEGCEAGCAAMVCGEGVVMPTCKLYDSNCPATQCPQDGCGLGGCASDKLADYPVSVANTCLLEGNTGACTANACEPSCVDSGSCQQIQPFSPGGGGGPVAGFCGDGLLKKWTGEECEKDSDCEERHACKDCKCVSVPSCAEDWSCLEWEACSAEGVQTRKCTDSKACGTTVQKPSESQACQYAGADGGNVQVLSLAELRCGNEKCEADETCETCAEDCGQCSPANAQGAGGLGGITGLVLGGQGLSLLGILALAVIIAALYYASRGRKRK